MVQWGSTAEAYCWISAVGWPCPARPLQPPAAEPWTARGGLGLSVRTGPSLQIKLENVEGIGHGGLRLNAAYRPGPFLQLALEGRRNTAGEMSLGLTGQDGRR